MNKDFAQKLTEAGVTPARLDALLERLDDEDGGDFLYGHPGRYIKRLIRVIKHVFDDPDIASDVEGIMTTAYELLGAVCVLYEDDMVSNSRISDETMDEVDDLSGAIATVCRKELRNE